MGLQNVCYSVQCVRWINGLRFGEHSQPFGHWRISVLFKVPLKNANQTSFLDDIFPRGSLWWQINAWGCRHCLQSSLWFQTVWFPICALDMGTLCLIIILAWVCLSRELNKLFEQIEWSIPVVLINDALNFSFTGVGAAFPLIPYHNTIS